MCHMSYYWNTHIRIQEVFYKANLVSIIIKYYGFAFSPLAHKVYSCQNPIGECNTAQIQYLFICYSNSYVLLSADLLVT